MNATIVAVSATVSQAIVVCGGCWYRICLERDWNPIQLIDQNDAIRCVSFGGYKFVNQVHTSLESACKCMQDEWLALNETREDVSIEDLMHMCPEELLKTESLPIQVTHKKPVEDSYTAAFVALPRNPTEEDYGRFYGEYVEYITRVIQGVASHGVDVEMIVLDVFSEFFDDTKNGEYREFDSKEQVSGFLRGMALNKLASEHRRQFTRKRDPKYMSDIGYSQFYIGNDDTELEEALGLLDDLQRRVVRLSFLEGKSIDSIAKELNLSALHVRGIRQVSRAILEKYFADKPK